MNELADRPLRVSDELFLLHWWRMLRWFANLRLVPRWKEHSAPPLRRLFRRLYYDGLTRTGKILLICSLIIFLSSYRTNSEFLLLTSAFGIALLLWSLLLGFIYKPRVSVERDTPRVALAGQTLCSQISVRNTARHAIYNFTVREMVVPYGRWPREWSRPHQMSLAAGHTTTLPVEFEPQKRGLLNLSGIAVQSYFPFFLTRFTTRIKQDAEVYVLPETLPVSIPSLRHIAEQAAKRLTQGSDAARKGPSLEYSYPRQYQTGDSLRRLDHRASSRQAKPMSKVFEGADEIRRDKVYLIVDLTLKDFQRWQRRPFDDAALDDRLALAVEIGLSAQNEGFSLAALATGSEWHPLENLLEFYQHITTCEPQRAVTTVNSSLPEAVLSENGLHILVVGRWTDATQSLVDRWQSTGILVLVFLLAESAKDVDTLPSGSQFIEVKIREAGDKEEHH
ncbi:MAG: DUF58 domain-containing protein [Gammaproteobacteria bacterium]|jgi:uncharacterized protein (DUF58 family)|nr:DUF58 domain-containing protein [Gammaproteobacteria bacterium]MDP6652408.1 DUF58 domain-containing protein [Gammaproteobacteria bacterium]